MTVKSLTSAGRISSYTVVFSIGIDDFATGFLICRHLLKIWSMHKSGSFDTVSYFFC
uniref:Uncharacterized protein n=1 Tax=uncultured marine virus TaxID=186617 RepID=A0A0F7L821_9VIRU|nr:hypothetical protein [uncultured marine virus]